jgi:hypothetical protein
MRLRSALLAGVSMAVVGLAEPAVAAPIPGVEHDVTGPNASDLLTVSLPGEPQAVHGDIEDGTASATAILNFGGGQVIQIGFGSGTGVGLGNGDVTIENGGSALLVASAAASNPGGSAKAFALDLQDLVQVGEGIANGTALIENTGTFELKAAAAANGSTAAANVFFHSAIVQQAIGNDADAGIVNSGSFQILGSAAATATAGAAVATVGMDGIHQFVRDLDTGSAHFTNSADFDVTGIAHANGATSASAVATVTDGVLQSASGSGAASLRIDNAGLIRINAIAVAKADDFAGAGAAVDAGLVQFGRAIGGDDLVIHNSGTYQVEGMASADAGQGGLAVATAFADWLFQSAFAQTQFISFSSGNGGVFFSDGDIPLGPASAKLSNTGEMTLVASAHAHGHSAIAFAAATAGTQTAVGSPAFASIVNSGKIDVLALAQATANNLAGAIAFASGLVQIASAHSSQSIASSASGAGRLSFDSEGVGPAKVSFINSGTIDVVAKAHAVVTGAGTASGLIAAAATAEIPVAVEQAAFGTSAHVSLENSGMLRAAATATAIAAGPQNLAAQVDEKGINQTAVASGVSFAAAFTPSGSTSNFNILVQGPASVGVTNSGTIDVTGLIKASAGRFAHFDARGFGVSQVALGTAAVAAVVNDGNITVAGSGQIQGQTESGFFFNSGIHQRARATRDAAVTVQNSGSINVLSRSVGSASLGAALDTAIANGIGQSATVATPFEASASAFGTATASFENSGALSVEADAKANGATFAVGAAFANGVRQVPIFGTLNAELDNSGKISALAVASAEATAGPALATANATAYLVEAGNVIADVVNSGTIEASASARVAGGGGSAFAFAVGVSVNALSLGVPGVFGDVSGSITNSGMIQVTAKVDSASSGTVGAVATGIFLSAPVGTDATITNSGTIDVTAITAHQDNAQAWGIHVFDFAPDVPDDDDHVLTINNSGTIIARQSSDGGATFQHGLAIDVTGAPNPTVINLLGGGAIYGDIALQSSDSINVKEGTTLFDGVINPSFLPAGGVTAAALDSGLSGLGTLNIEDGGNLVLADPLISGNPAMFDGPAYAFVDTLNVASAGTLTFQLQPESGGLQPAGSYPQIFANSANLAGTLVADIRTPNGLFADSYNWQNVIEANALDGQFSQCVLGGPFTGSLLLKLSCSYGGSANLDLSLTRVAFSSVAGLNGNGAAVATGLDSFFNANLTGGAANMFHDLFMIADQTNFNIALNQLSGSAFANYLNSFPSLGVHEDDLVDHATNCEIPSLAGSVLECRLASPIHVWGQLDYQTRKADGDIKAGTSRSKRFSGLLGIDANLGNQAIVGGDVGYLSNNLHDNQFSDDIKGKGWTGGLYAVYDPGAFYLKGLGTYSSLNGDSTRNIDFAPLATGATFAARPTGHPDVKMWTVGVHGGARFPTSASSVITPYLNLDYVNAKLDGFDESNGNGAALTIESSKSNHTFLTGGVKWATQIGGVVPEINLGYRMRFGASRSTIGAFFTPDPENNFDVVSAAQRRGDFLAGISVGGKLGPVDVRVGYEGEFGGGITSHSGNFKFVLPFGGHAAPPPPPVVAPPPPPPVAAPPLPPPPPPPPLPAPVERGERGQ